MESKKLWYAVQVDREDDRGTGSFDFEEAKALLLSRYPDGLIAVIDAEYDENGNATTEPICVEEILAGDL